MKNLILLGLLSAIVISGASCASVEERRKPFIVADPENYAQAMETIVAQLGKADTHITGSQYDLAEPEVKLVLEAAKSLGRFYPDTIEANYEAYREYEAQAEDLRRTADRMLLMVQLRKKENARDQLKELARRYNRLSMAYGPKVEIGVLERGAEKFKDAEYSETVLPGELSGNR